MVEAEGEPPFELYLYSARCAITVQFGRLLVFGPELCDFGVLHDTCIPYLPGSGRAWRARLGVLSSAYAPIIILQYTCTVR